MANNMEKRKREGFFCKVCQLDIIKASEKYHFQNIHQKYTELRVKDSSGEGSLTLVYNFRCYSKVREGRFNWGFLMS